MNTNQMKFFLKQNAPSIMVGTGTAGIIFTAFSSGKASVKASKILEEMHYKSETEPTTKEKFAAVAPLYIPTVIMGVLTISCFIASHSINMRRQAALVSAYSLSEKALTDYEQKVEDLFGKKAEKVHDELASDDVRSNPPSDIVDTGKGQTIFRDMVVGGDFKADIEFVKSVFNEMNSRLNNLDYITVNDLRWSLGIPQIKIGDDLGWAPGDQIEWHFSAADVEQTIIDGAIATEEDLESMKVIALRYTRPGFMPDM